MAPTDRCTWSYKILKGRFTNGFQEVVRNDWDSRCLKSIREEKAEVAQRYGIVFGKTEIYCKRCGKPCTPGNHICQDLTILKAQAARRKKAPGKDTEASLCNLLKRHEAKMAAKMLGTSVRNVRSWIQRGKVPKRYEAEVAQL